MSRKKVVVIGAGPGGLTAAMLLSSKGYDVEVFEKQPYVGGRNAAIQVDGYTFDLGPTFLMMKFILDEVFQLAGRDITKYLDVRPIDPLYRLSYGDGKEFFPTPNQERMKEEIERLFPGSFKGYLDFLEYNKKKIDRIVPCLRVPYSSPLDFLRANVFKAVPIADMHTTLFQHLGKFFKYDDLKMAFTFQAKYLGMSPWKCPAPFSIISYIEHSGDLHHTIGGLNKISHAMAKVVAEEGGKIHLGKGVEKVLVRNRAAVGVRLEDGSEVPADYVVINADFGHAMKTLIPEGTLKKWTPANLAKRDVSCSGFLLYLGVDKVYDKLPHHNIIFASDYRKNVEEMSTKLVLSEEPSVYVQNASVTDSTLAPPGHSTVYVLVPTANNRSGIRWDEEKARYREKVLDILEGRGGFTDLRKHIVAEVMLTPKQFEEEKYVYEGALFNLAHSMSQLLLFRPHNEFEELGNCYLVGGGTHPGSGLPTIYESARISAGLILKRDTWV